MTEKQLKELTEVFKEELSKARADGLRIVATVMLQSILEIAENEKLSNPKRIAEIIRFCNIGIGSKEEPKVDERNNWKWFNYQRIN